MEVEDGVEELLEGSRREEWWRDGGGRPAQLRRQRGSAQLRCVLRTGEEGERGGEIGLGDRNGSRELKRCWVSPARRRVASPALHAVAVAKTGGHSDRSNVVESIFDRLKFKIS